MNDQPINVSELTDDQLASYYKMAWDIDNARSTEDSANTLITRVTISNLAQRIQDEQIKRGKERAESLTFNQLEELYNKTK